MILPVHARLRAHLTRLLTTRYSLDVSAQPSLALEYPPNRDLGDLGTPVAFELAKRLRKAPAGHRPGDRRRVRHARGHRARGGRAQWIPQLLPDSSGVPARSALDHCDGSVAATSRGGSSDPPAGKAIVEHTAINPNKAAHIGHLRNAALGDTLVRVLRFRGVPVEVQNYIDDTGVQVADVVVGFRHLAGKTLAEIRTIADTTRFDFYCWDLYARVTEWYDEDKERLKTRADTLHDIEHGGNENAEIAAFIADRIVRCHLKTMARMNVDYDLLTWEGDILRLEVLGAGVRGPEGQARRASAHRGPSCRLLGDADSGGSRVNSQLRNSQIPTTPNAQFPSGGGHGGGRRGTREGHRPLEWRGHLRRQGHRLSVLEARACSGGTSITASSPTGRKDRSGRPAAPTGRRIIRRMAARLTSTT